MGSSITEAINLRLDLLIMPAFLAASVVGLYSVATNISWLLVAISAPLWWLVLPNAARKGERDTRTVLAGMYLTLALGLALALSIGLTAGLLVPALYGDSFGDAVTPLRLLLPGCVVLPAANIVSAGLWAANRPFTGALPHITGSIITVVGLLLFLEEGGMNAAAVVTSSAYGAVFVVALVLYRRVTRSRWRDFLPTRAIFTASEVTIPREESPVQSRDEDSDGR